MTLRDANFIAQARTLLPEYIAEVEKLRDWQKRAVEYIQTYAEFADDGYITAFSKEKAELKQLIEEAK